MDGLELPGVLAKYVMSDFESNIKTQFLKVWPNVPWRHCLFHFVKAVMKQVRAANRITYILILNIVYNFFYR